MSIQFHSRAVGLMLPEDMQRSNELMYCKKHIDKYIRQAIEGTPSIMAKANIGVKYLESWLSQTYYESKNIRLEQVKKLSLLELVLSIFTQIAYYQVPETFVSVTAQLARHLGFSDKRDSILTVAEITAVLCYTDAFDINKEDIQASLMVQSRIPLPQNLLNAMARSRYVLPMLSEPREIASNFESPYLTFNECQILGRGNGHDGDICLDVINTQNSVPLKLDLDFLSTVEEGPTHELDTVEKWNLWQQFKRESYEVYLLLAKQGNKFWLTNQVDKRGRLYAQGYHVTSQGSPFKKAMIEFHQEEVVEGVPEQYQL